MMMIVALTFLAPYLVKTSKRSDHKFSRAKKNCHFFSISYFSCMIGRAFRGSLALAKGNSFKCKSEQHFFDARAIAIFLL